MNRATESRYTFFDEVPTATKKGQNIGVVGNKKNNLKEKKVVVTIHANRMCKDTYNPEKQYI
jgi:hypothetical protein